MLNKSKRILRAIFVDIGSFFILSSLRKMKSEDDVIFLMSCALGDVALGMAYMKAYKEHNPDKRIILIAEEKTKPIIDAFSGYDSVVYYDKKTNKGKWYLQRFNSSKHYAIAGAKCGIVNTIPWIKHGIQDGYCLEMLRKDFKLPPDAKITLPTPQCASKIISIPDFETKKRKIIVINPYMHGAETCSCMSIFEDVSNRLMQLGYVIYTNVIGNQPAVKGTRALTCSIVEFYSICNEIPLLISVRTGLLDWVISTSAKKAIIYPNTVNSDWMRFYSIRQWSANNCEEYIQNNNEIEISTTICSMLEEEM